MHDQHSARAGCRSRARAGITDRHRLAEARATRKASPRCRSADEIDREMKPSVVQRHRRPPSRPLQRTSCAVTDGAARARTEHRHRRIRRRPHRRRRARLITRNRSANGTRRNDRDEQPDLEAAAVVPAGRVELALLRISHADGRMTLIVQSIIGLPRPDDARSQHLEQPRRAHAAADAHRHHDILAPRRLPSIRAWPVIRAPDMP